MSYFRTLIWTSSGLLLAMGIPSASAQTSSVHTVFGEHIGEEFGASVAGLGDVNGDLVADFVVGAPEDDDLAGRAGKAVVFSGLDGSVIHTFKSSNGNSHFGRSACSAGDIDGDGRDDIVVGKPWQIGGGLGEVYTYSGMDGSLLRQWTGNGSDAFGHRVVNMGDLDSDGIDEIAVSAHLGGINYQGKVYVLSGNTGTALFTFTGDAWYDNLGSDLRSGRDVDGDGTVDLMSASVSMGADGAVRIWSGQTGLEITTVLGSSADDLFGRSADLMDDLNGDGYAEFAVCQTGRVKVYSGLTQTLLYSVSGSGSDAFGCAMARVGDVDDDGRADFAVGAYGDDDMGSACGALFVYSGVDGSPIATWYGFESDRLMGLAIAPLDDVNGDAIPEIIVGGPTPFHHGTKAGYAQVYSGRCLGSIQHYGVGSAGKGGFVPDLAASGYPAPTGRFTLELTQGLGRAPALLVLGAANTSLPFAGGNLLVAPPFVFTLSLLLGGTPGVAGVGSFSLSTPLATNTPVPVTLYFQALILDSAAAGNLALSNAVRVEFR